MARLLISTKPHQKGKIIHVLPNDGVFGYMEDFERFSIKYPERTWDSKLVIVDLPKMPVEEAQALVEADMDEEVIDQETGEVIKERVIRYTHKGVVDYESLERRADPERKTLDTIKKIERDYDDPDVKAAIVDRSKL